MLRLGLRVKFFLYSNTLIVVTMSLVTILAVVHERSSRLNAIELRGRSICQAMTLRITINEDLGSAAHMAPIRSYISEVQILNRDLMRYVVLTDTTGEVIFATDPTLQGTSFERALGADAAGGSPVVEMLDAVHEAGILEVYTPLTVAGEPRGALIVGFTLGPIEQQVRAIAKQAAWVALLLMVGSSTLTAIYVETLIRPILGLNWTMKRAARGDLSVRVRSSAGAEVGELSKAFNWMMDEIEEARDLEKGRQVQLCHTEKMAAVGTLAAGVAHEVNNPLGGILACVENMRSDLDDRQTLERYLDVIRSGLERIGHTVANLLDFSRQREMELAPTSINHSLRHVVELAEYQLREGQIEVTFDLDPEDPVIMADQFQMDQLFLNLVLNALQAMPGGGRLLLRTLQKDRMVLAEVRDTGVGISDDLRDRIFDPFFTTRDVGEGTGLGLTVTDSIVSSHGGTLRVESTAGEGSVFRVSFPILNPRTLEKTHDDGCKSSTTDS
jgi:two-component system NtrC family sensor kinase